MSCIGATADLIGNVQTYLVLAQIIKRYATCPLRLFFVVVCGVVPFALTSVRFDGPLIYPRSMWNAVPGKKCSLLVVFLWFCFSICLWLCVVGECGLWQCVSLSL